MFAHAASAFSAGVLPVGNAYAQKPSAWQAAKTAAGIPPKSGAVAWGKIHTTVHMLPLEPLDKPGNPPARHKTEQRFAQSVKAFSLDQPETRFLRVLPENQIEKPSACHLTASFRSLIYNKLAKPSYCQSILW